LADFCGVPGGRSSSLGWLGAKRRRTCFFLARPTPNLVILSNAKDLLFRGLTNGTNFGLTTLRPVKTRAWAEKFSLVFLHIITLPFATMEKDQVRPQAQTGADRMWILYRNSKVDVPRTKSIGLRPWCGGSVDLAHNPMRPDNSGIAVKTLQEPKIGPLGPL
jgi:hypothetical protein